MSKKKNFALASVVVSLALLGVHLISTLWQGYLFWLSSLGLAALVFLVVYFLFSANLGWSEILVVAILPTFLVISFSWFAPLLPGSFFWRLVFLSLFAAGYYLVLLTENLFVVSWRFKTVPLYRTAFVTSFAFTLLAGFFLFSTLFSLKFSFLLNGLLAGVISFFLFYHLFWSAIIAEAEKKDFRLYALVASLLVAQLALVISFWPLQSGRAALYLVSWLYVLGGTFQAQLRQRLFARTLREYLIIGAGALLALFFSGSW